MLVLPHTDGFGIDLYQLGQGILEPSCNGGRASLSHVKIGKFLRGKLACGIHRGPRFIDDHILHRGVQLLDQFNDHLLRLPGSRAVSYADQGNIVFFDQPL